MGEEIKIERATLIGKFWDEYFDFSRQGEDYKEEHIWINAEHTDEPSWRWHQKYTVDIFPGALLGKLACLVCSKPLGIGSAERNWKQFKMVNNNRHTLGGEKTKKQTVIYGINCEERAKLRMR